MRVPASTSNLGSGFDTLGLAVNLCLTVSVRLTDGGGLRIDPDSANATSADPLIREAAAPWLVRIPNSIVHVSSDVPVGRGFGASAALRAGVVSAFMSLSGEEPSKHGLLQLVYALEHHPDNASPAIFGGFTCSGRIGPEVRCHRFEVDPALKLVTLFPSYEMPTGEARRLLPDAYSRADAAHSLNRAAMITAAMAKKDYPALRGAFDDRLHQPYRQKLIPQLADIIQAGERAGAIGGFLSGAGSAVICLALGNENEIGQAMHRWMPDAAVRILVPENEGLVLL